MMYVTLDRAKEHLNMDHSSDDNLITVYIQAASGAVKNYLKSASPYEVERDSNDDIILDSSGDPIYVEDSAGGRSPMAEERNSFLTTARMPSVSSRLRAWWTAARLCEL